MLFGRIRCCNPNSKSTKRHHKRNSQGAGIQLLMQNNAIYTLIPVLITLLWLPLALVTSPFGSFLDEVTIQFLPRRASNLNHWCAQIGRGTPRTRQDSRARLPGLSGARSKPEGQSTERSGHGPCLRAEMILTAHSLHRPATYGLNYVAKRLGLPQKEEQFEHGVEN